MRRLPPSVLGAALAVGVGLLPIVGCGSRSDGPSAAPVPATADAAKSVAAPAAPLDPQVQAAAALSRRVLPDPTPQVEHLRRGTTPSPFERASYLANPTAYLDLAAPERATEPAQPAADVPLLTAVGAQYVAVPPKGSVVLRARTEPGMPVTFSSSGLGSFESGVPTITVAADETGIASARFTATPGTVGACPILAASPVRGGTVRYLVTVIDP